MAVSHLSRYAIGLMLVFTALAIVPTVSAECYPRDGPCGLRQPPECGPISPVTIWAGCQAAALTSPCVDGCGFVPFAVGNTLWACNVVVHAATGGWCSP